MLSKDRRSKSAETEEIYEPPALVVLGAVADLTGVEGGSVQDDSDLLLKKDVQLVERPIELLRGIRSG